MHWFETLMWGLACIFTNLLTVVGLIGLVVVLIGGTIDFSNRIGGENHDND